MELDSQYDQLTEEEIDMVSTRLAINRAVSYLNKKSECDESSGSSESSDDKASSNFALMPLFDGNVFKFSSRLSLFVNKGFAHM